MKEYLKVDVVGSGQVDKYLKDGWEIIETVKQSYSDGETRVEYHIGLPAKVMVKKLTAIIRDYEKQDLKEKLFEGVAESFGENASDYETGFGQTTNGKTARYIENYEKIVNDKIINVYKKYAEDEF